MIVDATATGNRANARVPSGSGSKENADVTRTGLVLLMVAIALDAEGGVEERRGIQNLIDGTHVRGERVRH